MKEIFSYVLLAHGLLIALLGVTVVSGKASVAVLGGGVSGLTAAHELVERGFAVQVYERQAVFGGKARSYGVPGTGTDGRSDLPGEHGFRIFWNYYQNVFDTLQRIQYNESLTVYEYMHRINANALLTENGPDVYLNFGPEGWTDFISELRNLSADAHFLSTEEMEFGIERAVIMMTTCDERMREEFESFSFGQFVGAQYRSENFTKFWLNLLHLGGITPELANLGATTNFVQSLNSPFDDNIAIKVLHKPSNDAWIEPWVNQMSSDGAEFFVNTSVQSFTCSGKEVTSVNVLDIITGEVTTVQADYYVFAVPVDKIISILGNSHANGQCTDLQSFEALTKLPTTWMAGMQYYLYTDVKITDGFELYLDSPWRLSSVSFRQWWPDVNWQEMGDGKENGIISAIISNFTTPGILYNKSAIECTLQEIQMEVWAQMKTHLNKHGAILNDDNMAGFSLDTSLSFANGTLQNEEIMFFSAPNSWLNSPNATTTFDNVFLCGDYVQALSRVTPTTMEAANESARRAVNALLVASQSAAKPCNIFSPPRNPDFEAFRLADSVRYHLGMPHSGCSSRGCVATS